MKIEVFNPLVADQIIVMDDKERLFKSKSRTVFERNFSDREMRLFQASQFRITHLVEKKDNTSIPQDSLEVKKTPVEEKAPAKEENKEALSEKEMPKSDMQAAPRRRLK